MDREGPTEGTNGPGSAGNAGRDRTTDRIIFWALALYALGLAVMVLEDLINHTFL